MHEQEFKKLVARALNGLPKHAQKSLDNVAVTVARKPTREQCSDAGTKKNSLLLGLYEGVPETKWGKGFGGNLPDKITIFQDAIEELASSPQDIERLVLDTVWHEIAHHFGYDDKELAEIEKRREFHK